MGQNGSKQKEYPPSRPVTTKYGPIEGRRLVHDGERQVDAFQGIPYAAPPIGPLRFSLPQEPEVWTSLRETKAFGNRGIQKDHPLQSYTVPRSEDNLTLNVFTPVWQSSSPNGFAVLVFVHGGGFVSDSAVKYGDVHICEHLVKKDLVVVTVQYRLGFLGFWTTGDGQCPDNLALHDLTFALKWVQENIKAFNGDPSNVTVMGQSAGGDMVDILSISPASRDLFHKVIPMAGNTNCEWAIQKNTLISCRHKARELGIHDDSDSKTFLEKLKSVPADKFAVEMNMPDPLDGKRGELPIGPKYDTVFLPKHVDILRQEAPPKPRIIGLAKVEGLIMKLASFSSSKRTPTSEILELISILLPEEKFPTTAREKAHKILEKVLPEKEQMNKDDWNHAICEVLSDMFLNVATQQNVIENLRSGSEVYFYSFDYFNPKAFGKLAWVMPFVDSTHCTDISYVVGSHIVGAFDFTETDWKMVEITTTFWANFCKYGNPNATTEEEKELVGNVVWEPASLDNPQKHISLNLTPELKSEFKRGRPMMYVEMLNEKSPLL